MATVHIPAHLRTLSGGRSQVEAQGRTLRQVIEALGAACPGLRERLVEGDRIRPEMAIAVDGVIVESGMVQAVPEHAQIHLIPAISGGGARSPVIVIGRMAHMISGGRTLGAYGRARTWLRAMRPQQHGRAVVPPGRI